MLPKQYRLSLKRDFQNVLSNGERLNNRYFGLRTNENDSNPNSRFAFIVGKKVEKSAVRRNLIKRRLRSIVLRNLNLLNENLKHDVIIIAFPSITKVSFSELETEIVKSLINKKIFIRDEHS